MGLPDWRCLLSEMAALGMNSLGIGVYGCWPVQVDGRRSEFLLVPFPAHAALVTERTIEWFSPRAGAERSLTYRPPMFEEDFFGHIVGAGRDLGIAVRPHFNGPGHTTLLPRVYPEISARDEAGQPTGYGYCLSEERTYAVLFSLYDSVIERHLRPHGAVWWHLGLDEVTATAGIDPDDPERIVDPWCRCPECRRQPKGQRLVRFAVRSIAHLVGQGMEQITLWHDALAGLRAFPLFRETLAAQGLQSRVAVQWWRYDEPALEIGERGLRAWVTPMAGYWPNLFGHDYGANIATMAAQGREGGAEGIDAYCIYDPSSFRNYAWLAALGRERGLGPDAFRAAFAAWLFEGQELPVAFEHYDRLFDSSFGPLGTLLDALLPGAWSRPAQRDVRYPHDQVAQLAADPLRVGAAFEAAQVRAAALRAACAAAAGRAPDDRRRRLLREYAAEAHKLEGVVGAFRHAAGGWRHHRRAQRAPTRYETVDALVRAQAAFQSGRQAVVDVMADLEAVKAPYLVPHVLRDLTPLYRWVAGAHDRVRDWREQVEAGGLDDVPSLPR
jgi:hypothetical protein